MMEADLFVPNTKGPHKLGGIPHNGFIIAFSSSDYLLDFGNYPLVARGFAVILPNTRGPAFGATVAGQYGSLRLTDTDILLDKLDAQHIIDSAWVAVRGHSHGASLSYYHATHFNRFCAAVAVNGRTHWDMQATHGDAYLIANMAGSQTLFLTDRNATLRYEMSPKPRLRYWRLPV